MTATKTRGLARILVVDDEPVIRQVLINHLAAEGYRVRQASGGAEALRLVANGSFDLVLLDVMMPKMSGYDVCRGLRASHALEELPVILLTARTQVPDLVAGLAAGANDGGAAEKMRQLLDDLLALSRVGRQMNPPEPVSMSELACEAVGLVAGQIAERGVEVDVASDMPVVVGDRLRLLEVLQNLVENAAKYMGDQASPRIEVGVRREAADELIYVMDNGMGIDPIYHDKVFELFERLEAETETETEGTGVGLALVKRIVEVHGGRIWVESGGAGQGSAFCFTVPGSH